MKKINNFFGLEEIAYTVFIVLLLVVPFYVDLGMGGAILYIISGFPLLTGAGSLIYGFAVGKNCGEKKKICHTAVIAETPVILPLTVIMASFGANDIKKGIYEPADIFSQDILPLFIVAAVIFIVTYIPAFVGWVIARRFF